MVAKQSWRQGIGRWLPLWAWMMIIFIISNQPKADIPSFGVWDTLLKKGLHFLAYALLALLALRGTGEGKRPYLWALIITVLYAVSDEYHQTFIPGRHGQLMDVFIDNAGGLTALLLRMRNDERGMRNDERGMRNDE